MKPTELEVLRVLLLKRIQPRDAEEGIAIGMMFDKVAALAAKVAILEAEQTTTPAPDAATKPT